MSRGSRLVKKEEADLLRATAVPAPELATNAPGLDWFRLPDGRVLVTTRNGPGQIYSAAELEEVNRRFEQFMKDASDHYLHGHELPPDFVSRVPALLDQCRVWMGAYDQQLELTLAGLERIDDVCVNVGRAQCLEPATFQMLVATVGEVMRLAKGARWEMRTAYDSRNAAFTEAWLAGQAGWTWDASFLVYKSMDEDVDLKTLVTLAIHAASWDKPVSPRQVIYREVEPGTPRKKRR
jgi:hypothetical protein